MRRDGLRSVDMTSIRNRKILTLVEDGACQADVARDFGMTPKAVRQVVYAARMHGLLPKASKFYMRPEADPESAAEHMRSLLAEQHRQEFLQGYSPQPWTQRPDLE